MSLKLDLRKFKKIRSDAHSTTLKDPSASHEIKIAHKTLHPDTVAQLHALPHFSDGGVSDMTTAKNSIVNAFGSPKPKTSPQPSPKPAEKDPYATAGNAVSKAYNHATTDYAQGGRVMMADGGQPCENPNCPSCGSPHPNCQCYAQGGQVAHYADGSQDTISPDDATPQATSLPEAAGQDMRYIANKAGDLKQGVTQSLSDIAKNFQAGLSGKSPEELQSDAAQTPQPTPQVQATQSPQPSSLGQQAPQSGPQQPSLLDDYNGQGTLMRETLAGTANQAAGADAMAKAQKKLGDAQAVQYEHAANEGAALQAANQEHFQRLNDEHDAFMKEVQDKQIDPTHYLGSMSTMGKVGTAIGLMISGMGAGMTGQENMASKFLNSQIDRDIDAQKADLGKRETLLSANMKHYGNVMDAANMTRVSMNNLLSMQIDKAAAIAKGPIAAAAALQQKGVIQAQNASLLGQTAARQTLISELNKGTANPYRVIDMFAPEAERKGLTDELQKAQGLVKARDNVLHAFDTVSKLQNMGNRVMNPMQSQSQIDALLQPVIAELSKATAGKFTDSDAKMLYTLAPKLSDNAESRAVKLRQINTMVSKEMNFENLQKLNINPWAAARYGQQGQPTQQLKTLSK